MTPKTELLEIYSQGLTIRRRLWSIWSNLDSGIFEKFKNINGKTSQHDVPEALFQKRTSRQNRVLLRWKIIKQNNITYDQLKTFYGGVCVDFVNDDFFNERNQSDKLFIKLKSKLGSDGNISAIISFRGEDGDSGALLARENYEKFMNLPQSNFSIIKRNPEVKYSGRSDNSVWKGNLFYSIKGGSQTSHESHSEQEHALLFNPAAEYANEYVCLDIDIVMSYFALYCIDLDKKSIKDFNALVKSIERYLAKRMYDEGNLLEYCKSHYSLKFGSGCLIDPIQLIPMSINDFKSSGLENSSVVCHNESLNKNKFYFDKKNNFILSPARPTNFFWAKHLSNMMQQNFNLDEYFKMEEKRYKKRKSILDKIKGNNNS